MEIVLLVEVVGNQGMVWRGGRLEEESPIRKRLYTFAHLNGRSLRSNAEIFGTAEHQFQCTST
jgi:hypothetical protein